MPTPVKLKFVETAHCKCQQHCHICRDRDGGRQWREVIAKSFEVPGGVVDFECPAAPIAAGKPWVEPYPLNEESPPRPTIKKIAGFLRAMMTAGKVSDEVRLQRISTCTKCEFLRKDEKGNWCGACGCRFSAEDRQLQNLAAYKEGPLDRNKLPKWGCRHPMRPDGKGWHA